MTRSTQVLLLLAIALKLVAVQGQYDKLFVVGGFTELLEDTQDCEMINLGDTDITCEDPANFPFASEGGSIFLSADGHRAPVVCGGRLGDEDLQECYQYDAPNRNWRLFGSMLVGRSWMSPAVRIGNEVWVSGGRVDELVDDTSELIDTVTGEARAAPGLLLPSPRVLHCAVSINSTHVFVAGGGYKDPQTSEYTFYSDAYLVDVTDPDQATWGILPNMNTVRGSHVCGFVNNEVVVAGNQVGNVQMTEIFSFDTFSWSVGPELEITAPALVHYDNTILLVGGYFSDGSILHDSDDILEWVSANRTWIMRPEKMQVARDTMEAILVGDQVCLPNL